MEKKKCLVLFSGGLDSRITAKFMEDLGFEVHLCFVKLPFGSSCGSFAGVEDFAKKEGFNLYIIDAKRGKLLKEYINLVKTQNMELELELILAKIVKYLFLFGVKN